MRGAWNRYWGLRWRYKGPIIGVLAFVMLSVVAAATAPPAEEQVAPPATSTAASVVNTLPAATPPISTAVPASPTAILTMSPPVLTALPTLTPSAQVEQTVQVTPVVTPTQPAPAATQQPPQDAIRARLGGTRSAWVSAHGAPQRVLGFDRFGGRIDVTWVRESDGTERAATVEILYSGRGVTVSQARSESLVLIPADSRRVRTYVTAADQTVEVFSVSRLPLYCRASNNVRVKVWPMGSPKEH